MGYRVILFFLFCCLTLSISGQTSKKIQKLQAQRTELQKEINESEKVLRTMKKDVKSQLNDLAVLNGQIAQQQKYVNTIESDVKTLDTEITTVEADLDSLQKSLEEMKSKYKTSIQYAYKKNHSIQDKLMFIFSAENVKQMYRRMRYVREYTTYLKVQGEQVKEQQKQVQQKKSDLLAAKGEKSTLLRQVEQERKKLEGKQTEQKQMVATLQKRQKDIQKEIAQKQKQHQNLDAQIDRLVEQEVAAAKKREEERKKKELARLEAERKRKAELAKKAERALAAKSSGNSTSSSSSSKSKTASTTTSKKSSSKTVASKSAGERTVVSTSTTRKAERMSTYKVDNEDRLVSGGFERNKGLMPMPITGPYVIVGHFGVHNVAGLKNVQLDNKGIDIKGQTGAQARAIFQGEVSSVFSLGGMHGVLVRHGSYISVYCNLSSVSVRAGQKVNARDIIGKVGQDGDGNIVLQFQLRRETAKLNPESWLSRR